MIYLIKYNELNRLVQIPEHMPAWLEKFGIFYLGLFSRSTSTHNVFDHTDDQLNRQINRIIRKGILLSSLIGIACVFPTVWVDIHFSNATWPVHYGWVMAVTLVSIVIELYVLFIIALKAVHEVSEMINIHATKTELLQEGAFSVMHILSRTALELPDPELTILGIDPFERISKKNLFLLGLLYKLKILLTNLLIKLGLRYTAGNSLLGIPVLYEALPVECFWNGVVIKRVVHEARLRLFGFALANRIATELVHDGLLRQLSPQAKTGCLRAIGNAVVMAKNYHPNMIILLLRFQELLQVTEADKYDDWSLFLYTLKNVTKEERIFLLDLFTVAAAFDGRISQHEEDNLRAAYEDDHDRYYGRLKQLTLHLKEGQLHAALSLCKLDLTTG